ncbi:MAG: DUF4388 domain-containing protein [bacterium]|nr:DUF4388 domain-containing protein [bacterium]
MSIAGNLRTMSFPEVVQWLGSSGKTGTLVIDGARYIKRVHFRQGRIVAVSSDNPREMLGYYLVGWNYLTEDDLEYMIKMQDHFRIMLGELVVKLGHVTAEELGYVVRIKTEETIYDLVMWDEGEFRFLDGQLPERDFLEIDLNVERFLFEGARQRDERRRIKDVIPDSHHIPILCGEPAASDELQQKMVMLMREGHNIEEISLLCRVSEFHVLRYVHMGMKSGTIRLEEPCGIRAEEVPGQSWAPWMDMAAEVEDRVSLGRLFDAFNLVGALRQKYCKDSQALAAAAGLESRIGAAIEEGEIATTSVLESNVGPEELMRLECAPAEGFVLSRVNGVYTVQDVLSQLPGSELQNWVIVHNLVRRGLVEVRNITTMTVFDPDEAIDKALKIEGE